MRYFLVGVLFLAGCSAAAGDLTEILHREPESWASLDVGRLNARVEEAVAAQESWPHSPLLVTLHILGGDREARSLALEEVKNRTEGADATTVVLIRDGFLDDAVRGDLHEVDLRRLPDGTWRIHKARAAYRCRRSERPETYQEHPCS